MDVSDSPNKLEDVPEELKHTLIPLLAVNDASAYLKFLEDVFEPEPTIEPAKLPNGKVKTNNDSLCFLQNASFFVSV